MQEQKRSRTHGPAARTDRRGRRGNELPLDPLRRLNEFHPPGDVRGHSSSAMFRKQSEDTMYLLEHPVRVDGGTCTVEHAGALYVAGYCGWEKIERV